MAITAPFATPHLFSIIHRKKKEKLGIALLGLGGYAGGQLAPSLQQTEYCYLAGIVTGTPSKVPEWQEKYNIPDKNIYNYDNFDEIADNDSIDIVYVATPNALHMPYTIRAAQAGKHVICEKPMEISSENCRKMIDACEKANRKLQIGYRLRYEPRHQKLMKWAREKTYGKVKVINTDFSFYGVNGSNWRFTDASLSGGGPLMDIGIYSLEATRYATGREPISITAQKYKTIQDKLPGMEESIFWQMEFPDGMIANCGSSYVARRNYVWVSTENGRYGIEPAFSYGGLKGMVNGDSMNIETSRKQQAVQMDDDALAIINDTEVLVPGIEGMKDIHIVQKINESAANNSKRVMI